MTQAFLHNGTAKMEIRLEKLMALGVPCTMSAVTPYCVMIIARIRSAAAFLRSGGFASSRVYVESLQPSDEQSSFLLQ